MVTSVNTKFQGFNKLDIKYFLFHTLFNLINWLNVKIEIKLKTIILIIVPIEVKTIYGIVNIIPSKVSINKFRLSNIELDFLFKI